MQPIQSMGNGCCIIYQLACCGRLSCLWLALDEAQNTRSCLESTYRNVAMVKINLQVLLAIAGSLFWVTGRWRAGARFRGQLLGFVLLAGRRQVASQDLNLIVGQKWLQLAKWPWHGQGGMQTHTVCAVLPSRDALSHGNKFKAAWMEPVYHGF